MKVLITGGAGFLGRGILRRAHRGDLPWDITVYSRDEAKQVEARRRYPEARYVLGDVRDLDRLTAVMAGHDMVVHASAVKFIPEAELNAGECISVNVGGSQCVLKAVLATGVQRCVGISTDKACLPVNVYGASKMVMERLFADSAQLGQTQFACVRYGNVVGSTGSVVPLFQQQYAELGRVRVTNVNMTRFWMSIEEAIDLIVIALTECRPGAIAIPLARVMTIADVARAATRNDVEVEIIGERPGEKAHELLVHYEESVRTVRHDEPFFYELLPPGQQVGEAAFTLASHNARRMGSISEMRALIEDAKDV